MAYLNQTPMYGTGARPAPTYTLGTSDVFEYESGASLMLTNTTASAVTPLITGSDTTLEAAEGVGYVNAAGGLQLESIPTGATVFVPLKPVEKFLKGLATITGAAGCKAMLLGGTLADGVVGYQFFLTDDGDLCANSSLYSTAELHNGI